MEKVKSLSLQEALQIALERNTHFVLVNRIINDINTIMSRSNFHTEGHPDYHIVRICPKSFITVTNKVLLWELDNEFPSKELFDDIIAILKMSGWEIEFIESIFTREESTPMRGPGGSTFYADLPVKYTYYTLKFSVKSK